jgi:hypothetical protein
MTIKQGRRPTDRVAKDKRRPGSTAVRLLPKQKQNEIPTRCPPLALNTLHSPMQIRYHSVRWLRRIHDPTTPSLIARAIAGIGICPDSTLGIVRPPASFDLIVTGFQSISTVDFRPPSRSPLTLLQLPVGASDRQAQWFTPKPCFGPLPQHRTPILSHTYGLPSSPTLVTSSRCRCRGSGLTRLGAPMFRFETYTSCLCDRLLIEERIGSAFGTLRGGRAVHVGCKSYQWMW